MGAVFVCGSFAADGVGAHFRRVACGRRRSLLGRAWLLAGQKPGRWATWTRETARWASGGLQERRSPCLGNLGGTTPETARRAVEGSRGDNNRRAELGEGTWTRAAARGAWSVPTCACSARSRRSGIQPVMGVVSARFRGVRTAKPNRAREIFWKFSERVRPPSKVKSDPASEKLAGGAPLQARQTQGARPPTLSGVNWLMTHEPSQTYNPIEN